MMTTTDPTQAAFAAIVRHARAQHEKSVNSQGMCRFRAPRGLKCFIGALIPDGRYSPDIEGMGVEPDVLAVMADEYRGADEDVLNSCRAIHDDLYPVDWERHLRQIASLYHLEMPND